MYIYIYIPCWPAGVESNLVVLRGPRFEEFSDCAITMITYRVSTQPAVGAAKHHTQNAYLTALFGLYIRGFFSTKMRLQSQIDFTTKHQYQHEYSGWISKWARFWSDTRWFPPHASSTSVAWDKRGRGNSLNTSVPTSPPANHSLVESRYVVLSRLPDVYSA